MCTLHTLPALILLVIVAIIASSAKLAKKLREKDEELARLRLMLVRYGTELVHGAGSYREQMSGRSEVEEEARRLYDRTTALAPAPHTNDRFPSLSGPEFSPSFLSAKEERWVRESRATHIILVSSDGTRTRVPVLGGKEFHGTNGGGPG